MAIKVDMNKVVLAGRLTHDPENFPYKQREGSITKIRLACIHTHAKKVNGKYEGEQVAFITVKIFDGKARKQATWAAKQLKKGAPVMIEGSLLTEQWKDKQSGQNRSALVVMATNVHFLTEREAAKQAAPSPDEEEEPRASFEEGEGDSPF